MVLNKQFEVPPPRELLKMATNRSEWHTKTPFQKWCYLYGIGKASCSPIGITLFQDDQTLYWYAYFLFVYSSLYLMLAIYTSAYYISHGEPSKCLPCTCLLIGPVMAVSLALSK